MIPVLNNLFEREISGKQDVVYFNYYDNWKDAILTCSICGWRGKINDDMTEHFKDLFDVSCPKCIEMLAVVSYPTNKEIKELAFFGNKEALQNLPSVLKGEERAFLFKNTKLKSVAQLPEICSDNLEFIWDFESIEKPREVYNMIKYKEVVIWKEIGFYESVWRFNEVKDILKKRYGKRFKSLKPSEISGYYLYGDRAASLNEIKFY